MREIFGQPVTFCGDARDHDWHSDGTTFCPGTPSILIDDEVPC